MFKISLNVLKNFICLMICYRIGLENPIVMEMQTISTQFFFAVHTSAWEKNEQSNGDAKPKGWRNCFKSQQKRNHTSR